MLYFHNASQKFRNFAEEVILGLDYDKRNYDISVIRSLTSGYYNDTKELREEIAKKLIEEGGYCF